MRTFFSTTVYTSLQYFETFFLKSGINQVNFLKIINSQSANGGFGETIKRYFRVDRRQIAFVKFILEAYDGIAVLETLDPQAGHIVLHIARGCEDDVAAILQDLKREIMLETVKKSHAE